MLRQSPAELVCVGDGDETLLELVQAMEAGRDLAEVPGLMIKRGDELLSTPKRPRFNALDTLPFPKIELFPTRAVLDQFRQQQLLLAQQQQQQINQPTNGPTNTSGGISPGTTQGQPGVLPAGQPTFSSLIG
jgi:radical SAM superfamily enzyme YgiQ (UPF0313 family)